MQGRDPVILWYDSVRTGTAVRIGNFLADTLLVFENDGFSPYGRIIFIRFGLHGRAVEIDSTRITVKRLLTGRSDGSVGSDRTAVQIDVSGKIRLIYNVSIINTM